MAQCSQSYAHFKFFGPFEVFWGTFGPGQAVSKTPKIQNCSNSVVMRALTKLFFQASQGP